MGWLLDIQKGLPALFHLGKVKEETSERPFPDYNISNAFHCISCLCLVFRYSRTFCLRRCWFESKQTALPAVSRTDICTWSFFATGYCTGWIATFPSLHLLLEQPRAPRDSSYLCPILGDRRPLHLRMSVCDSRARPRTTGH